MHFVESPNRSHRFAYVVIAGQGRSGTNWLLDILDHSPHTHCRNEPDRMALSPFWRLSAKALPVLEAEHQDFARGWQEAVDWAVARHGVSDRGAVCRKRHLYAASYYTGLERRYHESGFRALLRPFRPELAGDEWKLPRLVGSRRRLSDACCVLKINQMPGWARWILRSRPDVGVIHIARHPGGFLSSWKERYLAGQSATAVKEASLDRWRQITAREPGGLPPVETAAQMEVDEIELSFWKYSTEAIDLAGQGGSAYLRVLYEQLAADPIEVARGIYKFCDLPWKPAIAVRIARMSREAPKLKDRWKTSLPPTDHELIERILTGSSLRGWWSEESQ